MRIGSCEEAGTRGTTSAGVIELGESQSIARQTVEVGRFNLTTITTDIGPSHIIRHDNDDIGSTLPESKNRDENKKIK